MASISFLPLAAISTAVALIVTIAAANIRVSFTEETTCPSASAGSGATEDGSVRQVTGATDHRTCLVECSLWSQCVAAYFSSAAASCQLGTLTAWLQRWQTGNCKSHIRPPPLPDSVTSKLLAFYNFRFSLTNQRNASAFTLTSNRASRTRLGLELLGSFDSNAEVSLMGRGLGFYTPAHQLTFFIKVTATYDFESRCFHRVFNRSAGVADGATGRWCRDGGRAVFLERDFNRRVFTSGGAFLPQDHMQPSTFSTAVAFDHAGASIVAFYYNGTRDSAAATSINDTGAILGDDGLMIGYDSYSPFKGFVHCYGIATAALTLSEVQQLETLC